MNKTARISLSILFLAFIALTILYRTPLFNTFHIIGISGTAIIWLYLFIDIIRNNIYNKQFWILSMILMMPLATLIYLIQREHLIRLGEKFGTKGYHNSNFNKNGEN
jgi:hypothetical protein